MIRFAVALALLTSCAFAQLNLYLAPVNGAEEPVGGLQDLGQTPVGDSTGTRFRIRNEGSATITLAAFRITGAGFSATGAPSVPHLVAPGTNVDFTVHFRPPDHGYYSANLKINSSDYLLRANGIASAAFFYNGQSLPSGSVLDFGRVERGSQSTLTIEARNVTREPVVIQSLAITGAVFAFEPANPAPLRISPGEGRPIVIRFAPNNNQIFQATLRIDDSRVITFTGAGLEPPMPRPSLSLDTPVVRSGEQGRITVQLSSVSRAKGTGQLRMQLTPLGSMKDNDAAAQFASGGRTASFFVSEGTSDVAFDGTGRTDIVFQTGTTAGSLTFTVEAGGYTETATISVAPESVRFDNASATRNGSSIQVQLTGFDNTRSTSELLFTFYGASGQPLTSEPLRVSAKADFEQWWQASTLGGIFTLRAIFPITGDASQIRAVEAQVVNASGATRTDRLSF